jgi:hypothetical protein
MHPITLKPALIIALLFLVAGPAFNQVPGSDVRNSLSIQAGFALGQGGWATHPYAPVTFFKQDLVIGGDLAFRLSDKLGLAVNGLYSKLNTGEWDRYARSAGDEVSSSASLGFIAVVLRLYLRNTAPDLVSIDIGPLALFADGSEKVGAHVFKYDFLSSPGFGGVAAIEYDRYVGEDYAVYVRFAGIFAPSALHYSAGPSSTISYFPATVGGKILF